MQINDLFKWQKGRQETGYDKMLLCGAVWPFKFDIYLLRFPEGSEIPEHTDKADEARHYRLNIVLANAKEGGEFICLNPIFETKRVKFFRPDISPHSVSKVKIGTRYVFSFGWLRGPA